MSTMVSEVGSKDAYECSPLGTSLILSGERYALEAWLFGSALY
jgi:hypothetical protein